MFATPRQVADFEPWLRSRARDPGMSRYLMSDLLSLATHIGAHKATRSQGGGRTDDTGHGDASTIHSFPTEIVGNPQYCPQESYSAVLTDRPQYMNFTQRSTAGLDKSRGRVSQVESHGEH